MKVRELVEMLRAVIEENEAVLDYDVDAETCNEIESAASIHINSIYKCLSIEGKGVFYVE